MSEEVQQDATVLVHACDASYVHGSYRSFEFETFEAVAGEATVLLATERTTARDMGLALAGLVTPTSGQLSVVGVELAHSVSAGAQGGVSDNAERGIGVIFQHILARIRSFGCSTEAFMSSIVGLGYVTDIAEIDNTYSVEEAVKREMRLRKRAVASKRLRAATTRATDKSTSNTAESAGEDALDLLAEVGLATASDRAINLLTPAERTRFSAALAFTGEPQVVVIDLTDPFVAGLSRDAAVAFVSDLARIAKSRNIAVVILTLETACIQAADAAYPLDINAAEVILKGDN